MRMGKCKSAPLVERSGIDAANSPARSRSMTKHSWVCTTALMLVAGPVAAQTPLIVATAEGRIAGTAENGVHRFLGVPYGGDTGGQNRFRKARPVARWTGVKPATAFGNRCPQ
ncbi:MAG: hypothetical protein EON59_07860, partial [Alphaproteobacteria bacterium]